MLEFKQSASDCVPEANTLLEDQGIPTVTAALLR
jgi:hypothetical protein